MLKRVVVTGAASGIGKALCEAFNNAGTKSVVCVDMNLEGAEETAADIGGLAIQANVGKESDIINVIEEANRSAIKLANTVALNFPSFYDVADYHGLKVAFLKRAQILAADLWGAFGGLGWGQFDDMDKLTILDIKSHCSKTNIIMY